MRSPKKPNNTYDDAFSHLPSNVIDVILSRLPLKDAVKTSVLSKEWRFKWMYVPKLVFDLRFSQSIFGNKHQLETIVYHVLTRHRGQVNKFCFNVDSYLTSPHIDNWICLLRNHKVEDFTLHLLWGKKHVMPSCFFEFNHLRQLNLYRCMFRPPSECTGFAQLVELDFQEVEFVSTDFVRFISRCNLLEKMRLIGCTKWDSVEIEVPKLRTFIFHGDFRSIRFKNCPVLAEISLSIPLVKNGDDNAMTGPYNGIKYFDFRSTLERVHFHPGVLKFLSALGSPNRLPHGLHHLKVLNLSMYLDNIEEVAFALGLARASENLQMLRVTLYASTMVEDVLKFMRAQQSPDFYLKKLKRVQLYLLSFSEPQMEFARLLLASASVLEEMVISHRTTVDNVGLRLMELKKSARASPDARIVLG